MDVGIGRILLVHEAADERLALPFIAGLAAAFPAVSFDRFGPPLEFASVAPWMLQEARARIQAADLVVCLVGARSASSPWAWWAVSGALDAGKRALAARLHANEMIDVPPQIVTERGVPVLNADVVAVVRYLEQGVLPPAEATPSAPLSSRLGRRG